MSQGSLRVTSQRRPKGTHTPEPTESVVPIDRTDPVLGNPYRMRSRSLEERARVISLFRARHATDFQRQGPLYQKSLEFARRVANGESIALQCWCAPLPCHGDVILAGIQALIVQLRAVRPIPDPGA